jgi:hypothetical protein
MRKLVVVSLFLAVHSLMAQEAPPKPEAPYPGAETEPTEPIQKQIEAPPKKEQEPLVEVEGEIIEGNKFRGTRKIKHPGAKQGLFRITAKGEYLYKTQPSPQTNAISVRLGAYTPTNLTSTGNNNSFEDIYGSASPVMLLVDYEWKLFSGFGKAGLRAGTGLYFAQGNGRFANGAPAKEGYTFFMLPNSVSAILYLQLWDKQPLIPYAEGGVDAYVFNEYRDDGKPTFGRFGGSLAGHVAVGGLIPLNMFNRIGMIRLDQEYGINNMYFSGEYRIVNRLAGAFDFSAQMFTGGLLVEF